MKTAKAFTLVELLVVITIITILAALLLPTLENSLKQAYQISCLSNLRQGGAAVMAFCDEHNGLVPTCYSSAASYTGGNASNYYCSYPGGEPWWVFWHSSYPTPDGLGWRFKMGQVIPEYAADAHVAYCPARRSGNSYTYTWKSGTSGGYSSANSGNPRVIWGGYHFQSVQDAYTENNRLNTTDLNWRNYYNPWRGRLLAPRVEENAGAHNPLLWDVDFPHERRGINVSYWDGSAQTYPDRMDYWLSLTASYHFSGARYLKMWDNLKQGK